LRIDANNCRCALLASIDLRKFHRSCGNRRGVARSAEGFRSDEELVLIRVGFREGEGDRLIGIS
jgi:hypothetical protein